MILIQEEIEEILEYLSHKGFGLVKSKMIEDKTNPNTPTEELVFHVTKYFDNNSNYVKFWHKRRLNEKINSEIIK